MAAYVSTLKYAENYKTETIKHTDPLFPLNLMDWTQWKKLVNNWLTSSMAHLFTDRVLTSYIMMTSLHIWRMLALNFNILFFHSAHGGQYKNEWWAFSNSKPRRGDKK